MVAREEGSGGMGSRPARSELFAGSAVSELEGVAVEEEQELMSALADDLLLQPEATAVAAVAIPAAPGTSKRNWWGLMKQRMWTKMDFLHLHAISGVAFSGVGTLWIMKYLYDAAQGAPMQAAPDALSLGLLTVGAINCFSCLPMTSNPNQAGGFKFLGVGMTLNSIWQAWWVSGTYPAGLASVDPWLAGAFLIAIVSGIVDSEVALSRELGIMQSRRVQPTDVEVNETVINHRAASYPNLLHIPVLYNILAGGQPWLARVSERWPAEPMMLYHACFAIAVANSIVFLCATLKDRKLMTLRAWLYVQLIVLAPLVTTAIDLHAAPGQLSIDPTQVYAGFI
ncbi:hypothetical protein JKP88DRAFT_349517 [Tribonema minus]|uniref:Uncharacterized protein n=1 Tax=Tribonema minus TaxID=303371 RepID=A0A835YRT3_9STRA|nr:hypothetical protein JKP88DRAFT_349517 [Tribonema minus]